MSDRPTLYRQATWGDSTHILISVVPVVPCEHGNYAEHIYTFEPAGDGWTQNASCDGKPKGDK